VSVPDLEGFDDDLRELRSLFLQTRRADLQRLEAARVAGDLATVRAVGHVFKGSCAPFGYDEAGRLGAALEKAAERGDRAAVDALSARLHAAMAAPPGEEG
jgi:HPt (histidine-containing phosphotransfer) domain-containing protein